MAVLRMGTRGSPLALAQSSAAARGLEAALPGLRVETVTVKTSGDLFGVPAPEKARELPQGAKGLWVKELEEAVREGRADFAVHSAKDLPAGDPPGLLVAAYPQREDPRDCLIAASGAGWEELPRGAAIGTSSLRRRLLLAAARPDLAFAPMRGNIDTRLRKLGEGACGALVLAAAGLRRLGRADLAGRPIDPEILTPAPGQGALALQCRAGDARVLEALARLDHAPTRFCVEAERAFLAAVGGGCGAPVAAYARLDGEGLWLDAFFAPEGASAGRRERGRRAEPGAGPELARELARRAREG